MAIQNLSTQYISASFQNLMQVSASGDVYNGAGTQVSTLNVTSTYATSAGSAAAITGLDTSIFATTGSNIFTSNQTIQGDVIITGNLTANQYVVSSSVYVVTQSFSSGSTVFGNDSLDTHQFTGSIQVQGSITGSLLGTASNAALLNSQAASYYTNASNINAGTISDLYLPATISSDITGNAATATSASYALTASYSATAPYSGLTGTVPTWNQNTSGNAATATTASYISPTFISASAAASGFGTGGGSSISASYAATASVAETVKTQGGGTGTWYPLMQSGLTTGYKIPTLNSAFTYDGNTKVLTATASFAVTASYALNGGGSGALIVADEGSTLTSAAASLNFTGNAVVATTVGNAVTVTIATGSGGGGTTSPGGAQGEAQYNDGVGSFAGSPSLTFDGAGAITKINTRVLSQDNANVVIINHDIRNNATAVAPSNSYALSGTQVALGISGTSLIEGQIVGVDVSGQWSKATSNTDISTGSLALVLQPVGGGAVFDAFLPGTLACVNLSSGPTSGIWAAGTSAYSQGTTLYLDASGRVVPAPTTTPGEHVRVMGHVYQNWTDGIDTFATFLFNPDGSWITL
jgi:hypothetical protein